MTSPISFTPQHQQPFTLEHAMLLEVDMLVAGDGLGITVTNADTELMIIEISRLQNSISHLLRTQDELRGFLQEEPDSDEDGELGRAVQENDITISSQRERITLIKVALLNKVGEGGLRHMGLDDKTGQAHPEAPAGGQGHAAEALADMSHTAVPPAGEQDDEGMHLYKKVTTSLRPRKLANWHLTEHQRPPNGYQATLNTGVDVGDRSQRGPSEGSHSRLESARQTWKAWLAFKQRVTSTPNLKELSDQMGTAPDATNGCQSGGITLRDVTELNFVRIDPDTAGKPMVPLRLLRNNIAALKILKDRPADELKSMLPNVKVVRYIPGTPGTLDADTASWLQSGRRVAWRDVRDSSWQEGITKPHYAQELHELASILGATFELDARGNGAEELYGTTCLERPVYQLRAPMTITGRPKSVEAFLPTLQPWEHDVLSRRLVRRPGIPRSVDPDWALTVRLESPEGSSWPDEPFMFGSLTGKITSLQAYADRYAHSLGLRQPLCASIFVKGVEGCERTAQQLREWWDEKCTKMGHAGGSTRNRAQDAVSVLCPDCWSGRPCENCRADTADGFWY